jgi:ribosome-binding factor A
MLFKKNYSLLRVKKLYEREISQALHKISQEYDFPSCSIFHSILGAKKEFLKIYLTFFEKEQQETFLKLINKKYLFIIKKEIAQTKKFSYIPQLFFFLEESENH